MTGRKKSGRVFISKGYTDIRDVSKELVFGSGNVISNQDMSSYVKANDGVPLEDLSFREQIMIDVSEAVGKFLTIGADVQTLHMQQDLAMRSYTGDKTACIDWYRRLQKECQDTNAQQLSKEAQQRSKDALERYNKFATTCMMLATLHQTIFDKPIRIFRVSDIYQHAGGGKKTSHTGSKLAHVRKPDTSGGVKPNEIMCSMRSDGSLSCALEADAKSEGCLFLNLRSVLLVDSLVLVREDKLIKSVNHYQQLLSENKKLAQEEYRNVYQACKDFLKLRGKVITDAHWRNFQKDCTELVALRKVLHNKDFPYHDRERAESHAEMVQSRLYPDRDFAASVLGSSSSSEASTSRQQQSAHNWSACSTNKDASGKGQFVRSAKAKELYGQLCLLGDENTQPVEIQFTDIAHEPDITVWLQGMLGVGLVIVTDGPMLTDLLVKARHRCRVDREGAELTCNHLLEVCLKQDPLRLMDFVKIGDKKAMKDYEQLMEDCMQHLVLRCVLERKPIEIVVGRACVPSFDKADIVVRNQSDSERCAFFF